MYETGAELEGRIHTHVRIFTKRGGADGLLGRLKVDELPAHGEMISLKVKLDLQSTTLPTPSTRVQER